MKNIKFPECNKTYAADQQEYQPIPAYKEMGSSTGEITCCWQATIWQRIKFLFTGKIWHQIWTFNHPLQPQKLTFDKPVMPLPPEEHDRV